jgi:TIR domain
MPTQDVFFFSYARQDEGDKARILKFFDDLCQSIRDKTPWTTSDPIGFIDQELRPGRDWTMTLPEALAVCKSIVCLYSPKFFYRPICGKEVAVYIQRRHLHGGDPEVILPVMWLMPQSELAISPSMKNFQYFHRDFPASYKKYGLQRLMTLTKFADDYIEFIDRFSDWVLESYNIKLRPLTPAPDLDRLAPLFPGLRLWPQFLMRATLRANTPDA